MASAPELSVRSRRSSPALFGQIRVGLRPDPCRPVADGRLTWEPGEMATILAFHAHPDDEVLATGGTLARLAADGHQVVIAVAWQQHPAVGSATSCSAGLRRRATDRG
jgi:GlcNAc-PI de-N-acetylase